MFADHKDDVNGGQVDVLGYPGKGGWDLELEFCFRCVWGAGFLLRDATCWWSAVFSPENIPAAAFRFQFPRCPPPEVPLVFQQTLM